MTELQLQDRCVALDKDGFLVDLDDWSEATAAALAAREDMLLEPEHWEIIFLLRQFYSQFQLSPATRLSAAVASVRLLSFASNIGA